ncbi:MAG: hypothetical protein ACK58Z_02840 [Pseudanabaena sp.]
MNIQLVNAIVQMTQTLSNEEQQLLIQKLNKLLLDESKQTDPVTPITTTETSPPTPEQGWEAFSTLGQIAVAGKLHNVAIDHDKYLYRLPNEKNTY